MFSCSCGAVKQALLNNVLEDFVCPICNTKLTGVDMSVQCKLESFYTLDEEVLHGMRKKIHDALCVKNGTDSELAKRLGFNDPNKVRPRRKELVDMNKAESLFKRPCEESGKTCTVWGPL